MHEDIPILNFRVPKGFTHEGGRLTGVLFEVVKAEVDERGRRRLVPSGEPDAGGFLDPRPPAWPEGWPGVRQRLHPACQVVRRKGKIYVINKVEPRYKARQG